MALGRIFVGFFPSTPIGGLLGIIYKVTTAICGYDWTSAEALSFMHC